MGFPQVPMRGSRDLSRFGTLLLVDLQKSDRHQDTAPRASELRASDADRDRIADLLRDALAEGRLTADEHAERVEGVLAAKTVGELEVFVRDLPGAHQRRTT